MSPSRRLRTRTKSLAALAALFGMAVAASHCCTLGGWSWASLRATVTIDGGAMNLMVYDRLAAMPPPTPVTLRFHPPEWPRDPLITRFRANFSAGGSAAVTVVPLYLPAIVLAIPVIALAWRDLRRKPPSRCSRCSYNVTGLPPGSPCPECGLVRALSASEGPGTVAKAQP